MKSGLVKSVNQLTKAQHRDFFNVMIAVIHQGAIIDYLSCILKK